MSNQTSDEHELRKLLETCATEPIQFLGAIQDYAVLIGFDVKTLRVQSISENFNLLVSGDPRTLIGCSLDEIFDEESATACRQLFSQNRAFKELAVNLCLRGQSAPHLFYAYTESDQIVFEHELRKTDDSHSFQKDGIANALFSLNSAKFEKTSLVKMSEYFACHLKELTSFDRVMVYRFHEDGHGEVIAEAKEDYLQPFLGLHYPESDIPAQARQLYLKNLVRLIQDVESPRVAILSKSQTTDALDLSNSIARHVSTVHIEYLKNMGVQASMSVSIVVDGKLWGLIACHHYSPLFIDFSDRSLIKFLGYAFASEVSKIQNIETNETMTKVNMLIVSMIDSLVGLKSDGSVNLLQGIVDANANQLLSLIDANSFYMQIGDVSGIAGDTPPKGLVEKLKNEIYPNSESTIYTTSELSYETDGEQKFCGALVIGSADSSSPCFAIWLRPEFVHQIKWAGKNEKNVTLVNGVRRLTPRGSFEEIEKTHRGQSHPFTQNNLKAAESFLWFTYKMLIEQLNHAAIQIRGLQQEAEEKDSFISNLSHELRTPLNNILGWTQLYREKLQAEELNELYTVVSNNSKQLLNLVNDLLDSSKIAKGKIQLKMELQNPADILKKMERFFTPNFKTKKIHFSLTLEDSEAAVLVDETRFQQVIRNVLQNSLKFTPKGGSIVVIGKKDDTDYLIEIQDTGCGIPQADVAKIFKQFFQADSSKSRSNTGMGLGLAISKSLIEMHGGKIDLSSPGINLGTKVSIRIPLSSSKLSEAAEKEAHIETAKMGQLNGLSILLLEDTLEAARFVQMLLVRNGAKVHWLANPLDAIKLLEEVQFDIVISDIGLPHMDGYEFIQKAKPIVPHTTKFIALSAYGASSEVQKSIVHGFEAHLVKPIDFNLLIDAIEKLK